MSSKRSFPFGAFMLTLGIDLELSPLDLLKEPFCRSFIEKMDEALLEPRLLPPPYYSSTLVSLSCPASLGTVSGGCIFGMLCF